MSVDMQAINRRVIEQFRAGGEIEGMHRERRVRTRECAELICYAHDVHAKILGDVPFDGQRDGV